MRSGWLKETIVRKIIRTASALIDGLLLTDLLLRTILFSAYIALQPHSSAMHTVSEDGIPKLTKDDFKEVVAKEPSALIHFFEPWSGHCKSMEIEFVQVAAELQGKAFLTAVDATEESKLSRKYNIERFSTLKLFSNGMELAFY
ncbi:Protein disulfide isomerase-like 1-3 [Gracilariopsis chorda]|uniref:Protein disulfide isomerase-like 1-3 n=1 Tax=Gracilariopsis chorda TaxID=448386 RepID=A0A2V3IIM7_9FLOR|nr:Protein disulfide isomerase-like 1-3 [Gracilariopsis chorda]|eukprot:PXF41946.1 Protein disulfide isomerase-like 1-3 [Gracilariopsis chorda]